MQPKHCVSVYKYRDIFIGYIFYNINLDKNQQSPEKPCMSSCFAYNDWIRISFTVVRKNSLVSDFIARFLFVKVLTVVTKLNKSFANASPRECVPEVRSGGLHLDLFQTQPALYSHFCHTHSLVLQQVSGHPRVRWPGFNSAVLGNP